MPGLKNRKKCISIYRNQNQKPKIFLFDMINITQDDTELGEWVYDYNNQDYLFSLLSSSTFEGMKKMAFEFEINNTEAMSKENYDRMLFTLYANQLDRITSGLNYSATDIIRHLKKFM